MMVEMSATSTVPSPLTSADESGYSELPAITEMTAAMSATSTVPSWLTSPCWSRLVRKSSPSLMRLVSHLAVPENSKRGEPLKVLARKIRMLSPTCSVGLLPSATRMVPLMVRVLMPSMEVQPLAVSVAHLEALICRTPSLVMVTGLLSK